MAFLSNRLIVAGNEAAVAAALGRRAAGESSFASGAGLGASFSRVDARSSAWALVDMARMPAKAGATARTGGDAPEAILGAMASVSLVAVTATADGDALKLSATGVTADAETRQNLEDAVRGILAMWRMAVQEKQPDLVPVLRAFKVSQGADSVTISGTLPGSVIRELGREEGAHRPLMRRRPGRPALSFLPRCPDDVLSRTRPGGDDAPRCRLSSLRESPVPRRPVHTYSIVARDAVTGEIGVAVQSHWFSVGSFVPWAEAGVGAVATQSFVDPSYGKLGLDLMRAGRSAPDALKGLLAADDGRDVRQVAMIDAEGPGRRSHRRDAASRPPAITSGRATPSRRT